ncbi:MAG TPA: hypothetical protein VEK08_25255 [Planctomycetota bacterium]|nr:hypothetical protein [Planctomycetota bacterium]
MHSAIVVLVCLLLNSGLVYAAATFEILSPRGGEVFVAGQTQRVRIKGRATTITIELSRDGGANFTALGTIDNTPAAGAARGRLTFTVAGPASANCVLRARANAGKKELSAISGTFAIVASLDAAVSAGGLPSSFVTTPGLADGSVTNPKLAPAAVTSDKVSSGAASTNFVLAADGSGGATWVPAASSLPTGSVALEQLNTGSVDSRYVLKSGDAMTGNLKLPIAGPTVNEDAVTKKYVDDSLRFRAWNLEGNAGTKPGTDFIGTLDEQPLIFMVNRNKVMSYQPAGSGKTPSIVGGSLYNEVNGNAEGAVIGGGGKIGEKNVIHGGFSTIGGGSRNTITSLFNAPGSNLFSTIGGGYWNETLEYGATVAGGVENSASDMSFVGGGLSNTAWGMQSVIGGGAANITTAPQSVIAGGESNKMLLLPAESVYAAIGGGYLNEAAGRAAVIGGGWYNRLVSTMSVISGGVGNTLHFGESNIIGGGFTNTLKHGSASGIFSGSLNEVYTSAAVIAGGTENRIGQDIVNTSPGNRSVIAGGAFNVIEADTAAIVGGESNKVTGEFGVVLGGLSNTTSGKHGLVLHGVGNQAKGQYSVAGGNGATADHDYSFVWSSGPGTVSSRASEFFVNAGGGVRLNSFLFSPNGGSENTLDFVDSAPFAIKVNSAERVRVLADGGVRILPASTTGAPTSGTHSVGELYVDSAGALFYCRTAGTPGTWVTLVP